jgi:hypothetical protein
MYLHTFGGSALLHLLLGYPRLILVLGIAGTVAMTGTPHGPGNSIGTNQYLAKLDSAIGSNVSSGEAAQIAARQAVTDMLESYDPAQIEAAVADTLRQCGPGCTDLSTPIVIRDADLLRRVLILHQLDKAAQPRAASLEPIVVGRTASARK